jgi:hypothetical protein
MCVISAVIVHKAFHDVSALLQQYPDDFWRALAKYALNNLAGGGGDWGQWKK